MLLAGDLGFSSLVLVVCLVFPVASLVIRRKWRLSVARTEEVRRLLVLASEEAARAELEATISHAAVSVPVSPNNYQCAVCYCPTTTRCARCKSVRYWYVHFLLTVKLFFLFCLVNFFLLTFDFHGV
uniref:Ubiquitin carboxyl-terminal hydrolase 17 n=1 Tax=Rhizophora mucronata TaxID=61149 RepID=A0A2P2L7B5_RHIMU